MEPEGRLTWQALRALLAKRDTPHPLWGYNYCLFTRAETDTGQDLLRSYAIADHDRRVIFCLYEYRELVAEVTGGKEVTWEEAYADLYL